MKNVFFISFFISLLFLFPRNSLASIPSGWDYNLTKRCAKSVDPQGQNYFEDLTDCSMNGNWTVAVESEKTLSASCPGPPNQSFLINGVNSPVKLDWLSHIDELGRNNWSINLNNDFIHNTHPCGAGHWTWYVLMDNVLSTGGSLPRPDKITSSATISVTHIVHNGAIRALISWQGWWDGKARAIEIYLVKANWGDNHPDPDIINVLNTSYLQAVDIDGSAIGISITPNTGNSQTVSVNWYQIITNLISRGLLTAPSAGWENTATSAVSVGNEVNNWTDTDAALVDMWVTNFRVEQADRFTVGDLKSLLSNYQKNDDKFYMPRDSKINLLDAVFAIKHQE